MYPEKCLFQTEFDDEIWTGYAERNGLINHENIWPLGWVRGPERQQQKVNLQRP